MFHVILQWLSSLPELFGSDAVVMYRTDPQEVLIAAQKGESGNVLTTTRKSKIFTIQAPEVGNRIGILYTYLPYTRILSIRAAIESGSCEIGYGVGQNWNKSSAEVDESVTAFAVSSSTSGGYVTPSEYYIEEGRWIWVEVLSTSNSPAPQKLVVQVEYDYKPQL